MKILAVLSIVSFVGMCRFIFDVKERNKEHASPIAIALCGAWILFSLATCLIVALS